MARNETDREDLLAEAVALVRRVELRVSPWTEPIVAGFRATGHFSLYIGQDLVYQFDPEGRLRRAHEQGRIYRTQGSTLAELQRVRTATETTLVRRDLDAVQLGEFRERMLSALSILKNAIDEHRFQQVRQFPADDAQITHAVQVALAQCLARTDWIAPAIPGKR